MAVTHLDLLLIDHANCEKKAASTALNLMYRYLDQPNLLMSCSKLAREELRHFEQVLQIMGERDIEYQKISPALYASALRKGVRTFEPARLIDILIVSAIVEARSCERFEKLVPALHKVQEASLAEFYASLLRSEARHFKRYLDFAHKFDRQWRHKPPGAEHQFEQRIDFFLKQDAQMITASDTEFRFHSGLPSETIAVN